MHERITDEISHEQSGVKTRLVSCIKFSLFVELIKLHKQTPLVPDLVN